MAGTWSHFVHTYKEQCANVSISIKQEIILYSWRKQSSETWFRQAEAIDSLWEIVDTNILRFAAILEEFLKDKKHSQSLLHKEDVKMNINTLSVLISYNGKCQKSPV